MSDRVAIDTNHGTFTIELDAERVATLADGRIFSAEQARGLGLVDELGDLERKADEDVGRAARARLGCGLENRLELGVVEPGDHRRRHDAARNPRLVQQTDRLEPP